MTKSRREPKLQLTLWPRACSCPGSTSPPEQQAAWQARVKASLDPLPWVFSGGHAYHIVAVDPLFDRGPEGRTFRDLLGRFWRGEAPEQVFFRYPSP